MDFRRFFNSFDFFVTFDDYHNKIINSCTLSVKAKVIINHSHFLTTENTEEKEHTEKKGLCCLPNPSQFFNM